MYILNLILTIRILLRIQQLHSTIHSAKGQGDLVGKTFQNCLNMTDD